MTLSMLKHMSVSLVIRVVAVGLMFVAHVLLARVLGVEEYGVFSYYFVLIPLASMFMDLGFRSSALRYVTQYKNDPALKKGYIRTALLTSLKIGVALSLAALFFAMAFEMAPALDYTLRNVFMVSIAYAIMMVTCKILRADGYLYTAQSEKNITAIEKPAPFVA